MDYEKKYKDALEKIRAIYDKAIFSARIEDAKLAEKLEEIFPELKESKDEEFRKYILRCCEETISADDGGLVLSMGTTIKLKNWLEKKEWIDKACEWLAPIFEDFAGYYCGQDLLNRFCKAMEE